jgi:hypothetical protein
MSASYSFYETELKKDNENEIKKAFSLKKINQKERQRASAIKHLAKKKYSEKELKKICDNIEFLAAKNLPLTLTYYFELLRQDNSFRSALDEYQPGAWAKFIVNAVECYIKLEEFDEAYSCQSGAVFEKAYLPNVKERLQVANKICNSKDSKKYHLLDFSEFKSVIPSSKEEAWRCLQTFVSAIKIESNDDNSKFQLAKNLFNASNALFYMTSQSSIHGLATNPEMEVTSLLDKLEKLDRSHEVVLRQLAEITKVLKTFCYNHLSDEFNSAVHLRILLLQLTVAKKLSDNQNIQIFSDEYKACLLHSIKLQRMKTNIETINAIRDGIESKISNSSFNQFEGYLEAKEYLHLLQTTNKDISEFRPLYLADAYIYCSKYAEQLNLHEEALYYYNKILIFYHENLMIIASFPTFEKETVPGVVENIVRCNILLSKFDAVLEFVTKIFADKSYNASAKKAAAERCISFYTQITKSIYQKMLDYDHAEVWDVASVIGTLENLLEACSSYVSLHDNHKCMHRSALALCYYQIGNYQKAKESYSVCIETGKKIGLNVKGYLFKRALASLAIGGADIKKGIEDLDQVNNIPPLLPETAKDAAEVLLKVLQHEDSLTIKSKFKLAKALEKLCATHTLSAEFLQKKSKLYLSLAEYYLSKRVYDWATKYANLALNYLPLGPEQQAAQTVVQSAKIVATGSAEVTHPTGDSTEEVSTRIQKLSQAVDILVEDKTVTQAAVKKLLKEFMNKIDDATPASDKILFTQAKHKLNNCLSELRRAEEKDARLMKRKQEREHLDKLQKVSAEKRQQINSDAKNFLIAGQKYLAQIQSIIADGTVLPSSLIAEINSKHAELKEFIKEFVEENSIVQKKLSKKIPDAINANEVFNTIENKIENYLTLLLRKQGLQTELAVPSVDSVPLKGSLKDEVKSVPLDPTERFKKFISKNLFPQTSVNSKTLYELENNLDFDTEFSFVTHLIRELEKIGVVPRIRSSVVALGAAAFLDARFAFENYDIKDVDFFIEYASVAQLKEIQGILTKFGILSKGLDAENPFFKSFTTNRNHINGIYGIDVTCTSDAYQSTNYSILKSPEMQIATNEKAATFEGTDVLIIPINSSESAIITNKAKLSAVLTQGVFETGAPDLDDIDSYTDSYLTGYFYRTFKDYSWFKKVFKSSEMGQIATQVLTDPIWINKFFTKRYNNFYSRVSCFHEIIDFIKNDNIEQGKLHVTIFIATVLKTHFLRAHPLPTDQMFQQIADDSFEFFKQIFNGKATDSREDLGARLYFALKFIANRASQQLNLTSTPPFKPFGTEECLFRRTFKTNQESLKISAENLLKRMDESFRSEFVPAWRKLLVPVNPTRGQEIEEKKPNKSPQKVPPSTLYSDLLKYHQQVRAASQAGASGSASASSSSSSFFKSTASESTISVMASEFKENYHWRKR